MDEYHVRIAEGKLEDSLMRKKVIYFFNFFVLKIMDIDETMSE